MSNSEYKPLDELKKMMLIINPVSGRKTSFRFLPDIIRIFNVNGYNVSVFPTGKQGDATSLAECYSADYDIVVCIGGDGTLNEVISGLLRSGSHTPIGYIPSGSTNDFASCHGISSDMLTAAMNIATGNPKNIDIGQFGDRYFSYVSAFGAFSWLSYTTPQNLKNVLGHSAYLLDAVKDLPKVKSHYLRFDTGDFSCEGAFIFGAICNSTSVAGTITLPQDVVDTNDGKFELLLVHKPQTIADWQEIISGLLGKDYSSAFLEFVQFDSISIDSPHSIDWSLDGEMCAGKECITAHCIPDAITLIL